MVSKEYRFIYGDNATNKKAGSAPGSDIQRGQKIGDGKKKGQGQGNKPGNEKGEEYYEVEITLEELAHYLFDDLELPDMEKKTLKKGHLRKDQKKKDTDPKEYNLDWIRKRLPFLE